MNKKASLSIAAVGMSAMLLIAGCTPKTTAAPGAKTQKPQTKVTQMAPKTKNDGKTITVKPETKKPETKKPDQKQAVEPTAKPNQKPNQGKKPASKTPKKTQVTQAKPKPGKEKTNVTNAAPNTGATTAKKAG